MQKENKSKITVLVMALICILSIIIPTCLAFFYDQKINKGNGSIGQVKLGASTGSTFSQNFVIGDDGNILSSPISVSKDASSQSLYVRVKVSIEFPDRLPVQGDVIDGHILTATNINEINTWYESLLENFNITPSVNSNIVTGGTDSTIAWCKTFINGNAVGDYFYLTNGNQSNNTNLNLLALSTENAYQFCSASGISFGNNFEQLALTGADGYFQNKLGLLLVTKFEAIQSQYISTIDATAFRWAGNWENNLIIQTSVANNSVGMGTISTSAQSITAGSSVTITINPATNYTVDKLLINGTDFSSKINNNQLVLSDIYENLNIEVRFKIS